MMGISVPVKLRKLCHVFVDLKITTQRGSVNKAHFVTQPNLLITPHN